MDASPPVSEIDENLDKRDLFKEEFKFYKKRKPPPSFENVIDFNDGKNGKIKNISLLGSCCNLIDDDSTNLRPVSEWKAYCLSSVEGFIFICNPFYPAGQRKWIRTCLEEYPQPPNLTNLGSVENIWQNSLLNNNRQLEQLRWVTLGYHHNWDTKVYNLDTPTPFPSDLSKMCKFIAAAAGFGEYHPEAAIVNFYNCKSTLAGHTDHSELDHNAPLVSISFGQTAVFLIGGREKYVRPTAVFVRSGDVMLMTGPSRLYYHGVPRIVMCKDAPWCTEKSTPEWEPFENYVQKARINVNVRQVFPLDTPSNAPRMTKKY